MPRGIYIRTKTTCENISKAAKGKPKSEEHKRKMKKAAVGKHNGKKSNLWIDGRAWRKTAHQWIIQQLGQPTKCEHCTKDGLSGQQIDWANTDHKYRKKISEWIRLCKKCHAIYDKTFNNTHKGRS